jgi:hypothetical protein
MTQAEEDILDLKRRLRSVEGHIVQLTRIPPNAGEVLEEVGKKRAKILVDCMKENIPNIEDWEIRFHNEIVLACLEYERKMNGYSET